MLWGKKEEKGTLPDLPPLRKSNFEIGQQHNREIALPREDESVDEELPQKQGFPSFPDSMNEKGFSQAAIKDAVDSDYGDENFSVEKKPAEMAPMKYLDSHTSQKYKAVEMEEWTPSNTDRQSFETKLPEPPIVDFSRAIPEIQRTQKNADIFVKLDKFYSARKALIEAQQKMGDVDELLKRIRENKMREEQELIAWEKELMNVKARINDVNVTIFEKVD